MGRRLNPMTIGLLAIMAYFVMTSGNLGSPSLYILNKALLLPGILVGLSFHEFAHAWVSDKLGDPTPKLQGRLSVSPAAHIDPIGFIAIIFIGFGWGKAVQIDPSYYKNKKQGQILVSLAGVTMNLVIAIVFTIIFKLLLDFGGMRLTSLGFDQYIMKIVFYTIYINIILMIFNLLPIPPLDGFGIVTELFDLRKYDFYYKIYNNGFLILMILILFNFTDRVLTPLVNIAMNILSIITPFY